MKTAIQTKQFLAAGFEIKAKDEEERTFEGSLSTSHLDLGDWTGTRDIVHPGAFKRFLNSFKGDRDGYVPLLDTHDPSSIFNALGHLLDGEEQLTGKTLTYDLANGRKLEVPEMRLWTKWQVIDGIDGQRVLDRMRPGTVRKMSMGYAPIRSDNDTLADGTKVRHLREVKVGEGSLVVFAMNPNADVNLSSVKSLEELTAALREGRLTDEQKAEIRALLSESAPPSDGTPTKDGPAHYEHQSTLSARIRMLNLRRPALEALVEA